VLAKPRGDKVAELRDLMTPKQVAEYLQLHVMTIYRYINKGRIPAVKIGSQYRIKKEAVEQLLSETDGKRE